MTSAMPLWRTCFRAFFSLFVVGALFALAGPVSPATAQDGDLEFTPEQTRQFEKMMRTFILNNPDLISQALQMSQVRQQAIEEQAMRRAITMRKDQLHEDEASPIRGAADAPITIVEFLDYRCGFCKRVHHTVNQLIEDDPRVRVIYKDFPILGPDSVVAAKAALAAQKQGKYFDLQDRFLALKGPLPEARVYAVAEENGLDIDKLKADMALPEIQAIIDRNMALGRGLNIRGTPTFIVGDRLVPGAVDLPRLKQIVEQVSQDQASAAPSQAN